MVVFININSVYTSLIPRFYNQGLLFITFTGKQRTMKSSQRVELNYRESREVATKSFFSSQSN